MTDKPDLDAIEARYNAATEGPYQARWLPEGMPADPCRFGVISEATGKEVARCWDQQDAEFYFNARTDIPALTAALREAWAENERLESIARTQLDLLKAHGILRSPNEEEMKWARNRAKEIGLLP